MERIADAPRLNLALHFLISFEVPMKARFVSWICFVLLAIFLFAGQSAAADVTFFVGGVSPGSISVDGVKTALDGSPILGFRINTNFVPAFGLEHTLGFSWDYLFPENNTAVQDAKGFVYNTNLMFNIPVGKIVPYLTAGAGLIRQYGDSDLPVGTELAFNYGGGLKIPRLAGPLGVRFDLRGYRVGAFSNELNLLEISGGILISLGK
jgi:hypothetical protein